MVQLALLNEEVNPRKLELLHRVQKYLEISEMMITFSHSSLQPRCPTWNDQSDQEPNCDTSINQFFTQLLELLQLYARIQLYCSSRFSKQNPPPWSPHSTFRTYQVELEQLVLQRLERLHPGSSEDEHLPREQRTQSAMCSLIWHCCVICLNRNFLPIPKRTGPDHENSEASSRQLKFPVAPQLFVEEILHRCQASAVAICTICKGLVWQGDFFRVSYISS